MPPKRPPELGHAGVDREVGDRRLQARRRVPAHDDHLVDGELAVLERLHRARQDGPAASHGDDLGGAGTGQPSTQHEEVLWWADPVGGPRLVLKRRSHQRDEPGMGLVEHSADHCQLGPELLRGRRRHPPSIVHLFGRDRPNIADLLSPQQLWRS